MPGGWCRACRAYSERGRHKANRAAINQRHRDHRLSHPGHHREYDRNYRRTHVEERIAQDAALRAINSGELTRLPCKQCGKPDAHAHHEDYDKPLEVTWLCQSCHQLLHQAMKELCG